ncbi:MAG TPA: penicillin-binding transpeptidase domain-containing protein [Anaerolineaceae bacterium]|nr:penicillin-binding transpeptidase domain-containing protein [Anaerolineaceae bacterium]
MSNYERVNPSGIQQRLVSVYLVIAVLFGFYIFRLFDLQVIQYEAYAQRADENRRTIIHTPTLRGSIYDRNGIILAGNIPSYNIVVVPAFLPKNEGELQSIFRELSELTGIEALGPEPDEFMMKNFTPCQTDLTISQIVFIGGSTWPFKNVQIQCNVDEQTARIVQEKKADWPGVDIEVEAVRDYPTGSLTAEIIGFLGPIPAGSENLYPGFVPNRDTVGYAGIESEKQGELAGQNGLREVEVYSTGKEVRDLTVPVAPVPGSNVVLTIDTRLQAAAKSALQIQIDLLHAEMPKVTESMGAVIAMNPKTGEIYALVSEPTIENNRMARMIPEYYYNQLLKDPNMPMFNHAISAEPSPGSVFKMAAAIGILNEGVVTPDKVLHDPGTIELEQTYMHTQITTPTLTYYCWNYRTGGHGDVNFLRAVAESCDVYFYKVGGGYKDEVPDGGLGIWRLGQYARALGYGRPSGIELPGEASGLIPTPDWKRLVPTMPENWATGDTYIGTIGQGYVKSTVIQVLMSIATLANDGVRMKPTLIKEITDQEGHVIKPFEPELSCDITQPCEFPLLDEYTDPIRDENGEIITEIRYPIQILDDNGDATGESIPVAPWVIELAQEGMRRVVTEGTSQQQFAGMAVQSAGKTGTAEYCDDLAREKKLCIRGSLPAHAWYAGYAPYDDPEIVVVAFVYHGEEGSTTAGPIVRKVMEAYFELKAIDQGGAGS